MRKVCLLAAAFCLLGVAVRPTFAEKTVHQRIGERGWDFKFKQFAIGAFCGPNITDAEYRLYKECGFNVAITPRRCHYDGYENVDKALDLGKKHGLAMVLETYAHPHTAWGGVDGPYRKQGHHPATVPELKWIHERFGEHPALIGYMLADDITHLPPNVADASVWMHDNTPHLWPWICQLDFKPGTIVTRGKGALAIPQTYPFLYKRHSPTMARYQMYCRALETLRKACLEDALLPMPMFSAQYVQSDSIIRAQAYSSIAYGAQGIWYFVYRGLNCLMNGEAADDSYHAAKALCSCTWYAARQCNHRILAWGPELYGRECHEYYHSRWNVWCTSPEKQQETRGPKITGLGDGKTVADMDDDLLVGILTKPGAPPLAMIVDKRAVDTVATLKPRRVAVTFANRVKSIDVLEGGGWTNVKGNTVKLALEAGDGQLVRLNDKPGKDEPAKIVLPPRAGLMTFKPEMFLGRWIAWPERNVLTMKEDGSWRLATPDGKENEKGKWIFDKDERTMVWLLEAGKVEEGFKQKILSCSEDEFAVSTRNWNGARLFTRAPEE